MTLLKKIKFLICKFLYRIQNKYKIDYYINILLILLIRSNHPKRSLISKKKEICTNSLIFDNKKYKNLNLYVGDSHIEFYGRNIEFEGSDKNLNITFWTGPTLLTTFSTSKKILNDILKIVKFLEKKVSFKKINLILSFGEIDIRSSFYQILKIDKSFNNLSELILFIVKNFKIKIKELNKIPLFSKTQNKIFFKFIQPTPNKEGFVINRNKIHKIFKNQTFPVLGSIRDRVKWRNCLEKSLNNSAKELDIIYIKANLKMFDKNNFAINKKISIDNNHTTDLKQIINFQKKIK